MIALIDSCIWIEYFSGHNNRIKEFIEGNYEIVISTINLAEVYRFMLAHRSQKDAQQAIGFIKQISFSIQVSEEIALRAAEIRQEKKFGLGDAIIFATASLNEAQLITTDSDFKNEKNTIYIEK